MYFTKRLDVRWGTYRQIECELLLFQFASSHGKYEYYHILSGVGLPLAKQDVIHKYFDKNKGTEFIHFDDHNRVNESVINRIKYYHLFANNLRSNNKIIKKISNILYNSSLKIQKLLKVDRLKNNSLEIRKGANWLSITDNAVKYILSKKKVIKKTFSKSLCADEVFVQTIIYNSDFYNNVKTEKTMTIII